MTLCAACGLPGHRYGRNEGIERFDPIACINQLRGELEKRTLPGYVPCGLCDGTALLIDWDGNSDASHDYDPPERPSPSCSGLGVVPDPETVEVVAPQIHANDPAYSPPYWDDCYPEMKSWYRSQARAALLAYARKAKEQT